MSATSVDFNAFFDGAPFVTASAPGRVNLLGEHTDYNDGFMLPVATPQSTTVRLAPRRGPLSRYRSATLDEQVEFDCAGAGDRIEAIPPGFARYVAGCVRLLEQHSALTVPPLSVHIASSVPPGAGLSSSAALEVATLRALRQLLGVALDDVELALLAQQAEIRYAGVHCGVMDQMASSLARQTAMLFLDARSLATRLLPLPAGCAIIVLDSGVPRLLAASKYNERRDECRRAAALLGVPSLRDVDDSGAVEALPEPLRRRARHVVSENARVLQACGGVDGATFGALMNASHASLRDDYEVSIVALDRLSEALRAQPGVFGARLTGAGFGGACVALCRQDAAFDAAGAALAHYNGGTPGGAARQLIPAPSIDNLPERASI